MATPGHVLGTEGLQPWEVITQVDACFICWDSSFQQGDILSETAVGKAI